MIHICCSNVPSFPRICIRRLSSYVDLGTDDAEGASPAAHHMNHIKADGPVGFQEKMGKLPIQNEQC